MTASAMTPPSAPVKSAPTERAPRRSPRDAARCIVGEYLRDWGLRDPDAIAAQSRDIVEQAVQTFPDLSVNAPELAAAALAITVDRVTSAVMFKPVALAGGALTPQASVVAEVGHLLEEYPHLAATSADSSGLFEAAAAPIIPQPRRGEMLPQPGTRLLRVLSPAWYQAVARRVLLAFDEPVQGTETI